MTKEEKMILFIVTMASDSCDAETSTNGFIPSIPSNARITEGGDVRVTESGDVRVTES